MGLTWTSFTRWKGILHAKHLDGTRKRDKSFFPLIQKGRKKNALLFQESLKRLEDDAEFEIHYLINVPHKKTNLCYNAADVVVMTSLWEGSPNVIKESMACNCPVVSVNVGDVARTVGETDNCHITENRAEDIALAMKKVLSSRRRAPGRNRIMELKLDNGSILWAKILNKLKYSSYVPFSGERIHPLEGDVGPELSLISYPLYPETQ